MVTASARKPNYFFVVFGEDPSKGPIEGGLYTRKKGHIGGSGVSEGDVLLLYKNLGCEGIGVVTGIQTGKEPEFIRYQYFPLCHPVAWYSRDSIGEMIPGLHLVFNSVGNWLQKINSNSFRAVIAGRQIDWPT